MINYKVKAAGIAGLATAMLLGVHVSAAQVAPIWSGSGDYVIRSDFEFDEADEMNYDDPKHIQLSNENNDLDLYRFIPKASGTYEINVSDMDSGYLIGIIDFEEIKDYQEVNHTASEIYWYSSYEPDNKSYCFESGKTYYVLAWTKGTKAEADYWLSFVNYEGEGNPYGRHGWIERAGGVSYIEENCELAEGWTQIIENWYFFDEDNMLQTGWISDNGKWYYSDSSGVMVTGWEQVSGKWYYFTPSGVMTTGWKQISGKWYFFNGSGAMVTGWQQISGKWYFFNGSGSMVTGWKQISGKWYFFNGSGVMVTGWQQISGKWYYFNNSGAMATGWLKLSGKWYYLDPSSGAMVTGTKTIGGKAYNFDSNGVCQNP